MPPEMWMPLLVMAAGYYLFVFSVWISRIRNEIILREEDILGQSMGAHELIFNSLEDFFGWKDWGFRSERLLDYLYCSGN